MTIQTIQDLNKEILSVINEKTNLKDYDLEDYNNYLLYDVEKKIKENFINNCIKKHNLLNLDYYKLQSQLNKELKNTNIFNFGDIEQQIKSFINGFSKEDRIKETTPYLCIEKHLNKIKKNYFSFYDFQKEYFIYNDEGLKIGTNEEKLKADIKTAFDNKKEVCFTYWLKNAYGYKIKETLGNLLEFINLQFGINTICDFSNLDKDLKDYEKEINKNSVLKVRLFNEFMYLSFTDSQKQQELKDFFINQTIKRAIKD